VLHAFFKRILFLGVGSLMSQLGGAQDSRFYGSLLFVYPSFLYLLVSCLCLGGFPFFVGFYSKDLIISSVSFIRGYTLYFIFLCGCLFTVIYSIRLVYIFSLSFYKGFIFLSFFDSYIYFFFVSLLFFFGWLLGGVFCWVFFVELYFFFSFFDFVVGLLLIFVRGLFFCFLYFFYGMFYFISKIGFLQWGASGGSSWRLVSFKYNKYETS
jgi:NADH-quinone oxidoreductase subunit L